MKKYTISHLNKTFETINFDPSISDELCEDTRTMFFIKPNIIDVNKQIIKLYNGGFKHNLVIDYFIKEVLITSKLNTAKWTIYEFMQSNDLMRFALTKIKNFPKVFPIKYTNAKNINTVFRIAPSGTAPKVSNFPYKVMVGILEKYNINNNYYDYSCGWGIRLLVSLSKGVNYYGTEPNETLTIQLRKLTNHYKKIISPNINVGIRSHGSEIFIPELENKIGLSFSSPPYYNFEDYRYKGQSTDGRDYKEWLNDYWNKTVVNIKKYLISNGYFLLNIKSIKGYDLVTDMNKIIVDNGFQFIESFELKNINRVFLKQNDKNTNEQIYVYRKVL